MGQNNNFQGPEINCWVAQGSLPSVFFFLNETKQKHLLYLTSTLLALIDLISVIKDVFVLLFTLGLLAPPPPQLIFLGSLSSLFLSALTHPGSVSALKAKLFVFKI